METVREVINSNALTQIFNIPASLQNRNVEVVITLAKNEKKTSTLGKSSRGRLNRYANPELMHMEKGTWAASVGEKYANS